MIDQTKRLSVGFKPCVENGKFVFDSPPTNEIDILNLLPTDPEYMTFQFYSKTDHTNICHISLTNKRGRLEVSYGTESEFRNNGYMIEALDFAVKWIFNNTTEGSIWALPNSDISKAILKKCNFIDQGTHENYSKMNWFKIERIS